MANGMARYSSFLGHRVEVQYRASDTLLPASGTLVADSGRSIFLEESFEQRGQHRHFRWEIPYQCLIRIAVTRLDDSSPVTTSATRRADLSPESVDPPGEPSENNPETTKKFASSAAAGVGRSAVVLPFGKRAQNA
jgi:hypothetical protein